MNRVYLNQIINFINSDSLILYLRVILLFWKKERNGISHPGFGTEPVYLSERYQEFVPRMVFQSDELLDEISYLFFGAFYGSV